MLKKVLNFNRLAVKIPTMIALVICIVMLFSCVVLTTLIDRVLTGMTNDKLEDVAQMDSMEVEKYLSTMLNFSKDLGNQLSMYTNIDDELKKDILVSSLKNALKDDKIFSAYYAFEPNNYFANTPNGLSLYAYRDGEKIGVDIFNDFDSYGTADYYLPAKKNLETHVTEPYPWELTNGKTINLITLSSPVLDENGKFLGVANCDIDASALSSLELVTGKYKKAYVAIASEKGICLAHTKDTKLAGKEFDVVLKNKEIATSLEEKKAFSAEIKDKTLDNKVAKVYINPINFKGTDVNWSTSFIVEKLEAKTALIRIAFAMIVMFALGIIVLIIFSRILIKKALHPIAAVMEMADNMGNCQLNANSEIKVAANDELGQLSAIFNSTSKTMCGYINKIGELLQSISKGDLDIQVDGEFKGEFNLIKQDLVNILDSLNEAFRNIKDVEIEVNMGAEHFASTAENMSNTSQEQAVAIEELSQKISEINEKLKESADKSLTANENATLVDKELENSANQMKELLAAMTKITDTSSEIGKIIKTIEDIAFQTNILALNAAVEAARAGEAGKGFAVVADEVRNLASKSAEAAKDTTALIESSIHSVEEGAKYANITASSLENVVSGTKEMITVISDISMVTSEQSVALESINAGIADVSNSVTNSAGIAEENAAMSTELRNQAGILHEQLEKFKIKRLDTFVK